VLPDLLRCLVITWSSERADLLRLAAESQSWQPTVHLEIAEFLRSLFLLRVPLTFVDLPAQEASSYSLLKQAADRAVEFDKSLVVVCGACGCPTEESWARQLGVWAYLPGSEELAGLELMFGDARQAVAQRALSLVELDSYR
jgi:hypothetical protein